MCVKVMMMGKDYKELRSLRQYVDKTFKKKSWLKNSPSYDLFLYQTGLLFAVSDKDIIDVVVTACKVHNIVVDDNEFKKKVFEEEE